MLRLKLVQKFNEMKNIKMLFPSESLNDENKFSVN